MLAAMGIIGLCWVAFLVGLWVGGSAIEQKIISALQTYRGQGLKADDVITLIELKFIDKASTVNFKE